MKNTQNSTIKVKKLSLVISLIIIENSKKLFYFIKMLINAYHFNNFHKLFQLQPSNTISHNFNTLEDIVDVRCVRKLFWKEF